LQLSGGLYGALIVLEPGQKFDPATDRVVLLGGGGPAIEVNRSTNPAPIDLKVGVKYRFRLINITPNFTAVVSIRGDGGLQQWRATAKDGAELPPSQTTKRPAQQVISVGETYDFEFEPAVGGELRLEVVRRGVNAFLTSTVVRVSR
jgi:FtsP/CotA-like multicopper oxidase with cupredoxin domain